MIRILAHLVLSVLFFGIPFTCTAQSERRVIASYFGSDLDSTKIDQFLDERTAALKIPGLALAIINDGKVVYHKTMGYADLEKKLPVTENTIFEGASMSKSLFAFFVMTYVEEGRLDLDKPLYTYLPYADIEHDERYKKITARMVLSHRSGFPNWRTDEADGQLKIKFEPGTDYMYSGEGYQYLAMVLREMEKTDWPGLDSIFQRKIGAPLGLKHTVFIQTPYTRSNKAEPYDENGAWIDWKSKESEERFGAAYSIHSEPLDFSKWMIGVMDKKILKEESYQELFRPHSHPPSDGPIDLSYSLGFFIPKLPLVSTDIYAHSGNNDGFTSLFVLDAERDWGFVMFTNSQNGTQLGDDLFGYLIIEPELPIILIVAATFLILILIGFVYVFRFFIRKIKKQRASTITR
jgi:CubicO group peptidase (beta-lactamase class C family)